MLDMTLQAVLAVTAAFCLWFYFPKVWPNYNNPVEISWVWWTFLVWPLLCLIFGSFLPGLLWIADLLVFRTNTVGISLFASLTFLLALAVGWPAGWYQVPTGRMALLTVGGSRVPFFLLEGVYAKTLLGLIGRSVQVLIPFTDSEGFFFRGYFTFQLWNHGDEPDKLRLSNIGADDAELFIVVTLMCRLSNAFRATNTGQSPLMFGEVVRKVLRKVLTFFIASDSGALVSYHGPLMMGRKFMATYLRDRFDIHAKQSVVRDASHFPILREWVEIEGETKDERNKRWIEVTKLYRDEIHLKTTKEMEDALAKNRGSREPQITLLDAGPVLMKVAYELGLEIFEVAVSDFANNDTYQALANQLASEGKQLAAQAASAASIANAMRIIDKQLKEGTPLAAAIAAALDKVPGVNINILGGDSKNPFADAAAIMQSQNN